MVVDSQDITERFENNNGKILKFQLKSRTELIVDDRWTYDVIGEIFSINQVAGIEQLMSGVVVVS